MIEETIRVAHVIGKWLGGGVESVVMNYYRNIDRDKIQFDFICDEDSTNIPYHEIEKNGGRVILIPPYQKIFKYQKKLQEIFRENHYKIIHSHINTLSIFPLMVAKKEGIPIRIAHSHSTTNKVEWKKNLLKNLLRPFAKIYATEYFACTEHAGRWLFGNKSFDDGKVYLCNNAIDTTKFLFNEKIRKKKRRELNIDDDILVIGHIGRFVKQKNHEFLMEIFSEVHKKNPNTHLILVGQGPLEERVKEKAKSLNLLDSIDFLGQRDDVNEIYQAFDIFVLPSLYEGLGMVLIEAQYSGLYCIASDEVPNVAKIGNNLEFLSIKNGKNEWCRSILKKGEFYNRKDNEIIDSEYNIEIEAKRLQNKYFKLKEENDVSSNEKRK